MKSAAVIGRQTRTSEAISIVERDCRFDGRLEGSASALVNGVFEGDIRLGNLVVGPDATVTATVICLHAEIFGSLAGHVRCDSVTLHPGASFKGVVEHRRLHVAPGATFEGLSIPAEARADAAPVLKALEG